MPNETPRVSVSKALPRAPCPGGAVLALLLTAGCSIASRTPTHPTPSLTGAAPMTPAVHSTLTPPPPIGTSTGRAPETRSTLDSLPGGEYVIYSSVSELDGRGTSESSLYYASIDGLLGGLIAVGPGGGSDLSPDLSAVAYSLVSAGAFGFQTMVFIAPLDGTARRELSAARGCSSPSWDPSGARIVVDCGDVGRLFVVSAQDASTTPLTSDAAEGESWYLPRWSPDGRWISALMSTGAQAGNTQSGLYLISADCTQACAQNAIGPYGLLGPHDWSPDSRRLAVAQANRSIAILAIDIGDIRSLPTLQGYGFPESIAWSPSGDWIAFSQGEGRTDAALDVFVMSFPGGEISKVAESEQHKYVVDFISIP